jgi:high-affinity Fe2+/Pb2+ permease
MRQGSWIRVAIWAGAAVALVLGFAAYQRPEVAVDLANRLWACF